MASSLLIAFILGVLVGAVWKHAARWWAALMLLWCAVPRKSDGLVTPNQFYTCDGGQIGDSAHTQSSELLYYLPQSGGTGFFSSTTNPNTGARACRAVTAASRTIALGSIATCLNPNESAAQPCEAKASQARISGVNGATQWAFYYSVSAYPSAQTWISVLGGRNDVHANPGSDAGFSGDRIELQQTTGGKLTAVAYGGGNLLPSSGTCTTTAALSTSAYNHISVQFLENGGLPATESVLVRLDNASTVDTGINCTFTLNAGSYPSQFVHFGHQISGSYTADFDDMQSNTSEAALSDWLLPTKFYEATGTSATTSGTAISEYSAGFPVCLPTSGAGACDTTPERLDAVNQIPVDRQTTVPYVLQSAVPSSSDQREDFQHVATSGADSRFPPVAFAGPLVAWRVMVAIDGPSSPPVSIGSRDPSNTANYCVGGQLSNDLQPGLSAWRTFRQTFTQSGTHGYGGQTDNSNPCSASIPYLLNSPCASNDASCWSAKASTMVMRQGASPDTATNPVNVHEVHFAAGFLVASIPTPTPTLSPVQSPTRTWTKSPTITKTPLATPSFTKTATHTKTPTPTFTNTSANTPTVTPTLGPTQNVQFVPPEKQCKQDLHEFCAKSQDDLRAVMQQAKADHDAGASQVTVYLDADYTANPATPTPYSVSAGGTGLPFTGGLGYFGGLKLKCRSARTITCTGSTCISPRSDDAGTHTGFSIEGCTIDCSGQPAGSRCVDLADYDFSGIKDSTISASSNVDAVTIATGNDDTIERTTITNAARAIVVDNGGDDTKGRNLSLINNTITGATTGLHLFRSAGALVSRNRIKGGGSGTGILVGDATSYNSFDTNTIDSVATGINRGSGAGPNTYRCNTFLNVSGEQTTAAGPSGDAVQSCDATISDKVNVVDRSGTRTLTLDSNGCFTYQSKSICIDSVTANVSFPGGTLNGIAPAVLDNDAATPAWALGIGLLDDTTLGPRFPKEFIGGSNTTTGLLPQFQESQSGKLRILPDPSSSLVSTRCVPATSTTPATCYIAVSPGIPAAFALYVDKFCVDIPDCGPIDKPCCTVSKALARMQTANDNGFSTCSNDNQIGCGHCSISDTVQCNEDRDCPLNVCSTTTTTQCDRDTDCPTDETCGLAESCVATDEVCGVGNTCTGPRKTYNIFVGSGQYNELVTSQELRPGYVIISARVDGQTILSCSTLSNPTECPSTYAQAYGFTFTPNPEECVVDFTNTSNVVMRGVNVATGSGGGRIPLCAFQDVAGPTLINMQPTLFQAHGWAYWSGPSRNGRYNGHHIGGSQIYGGIYWGVGSSTGNLVHLNPAWSACADNEGWACSTDADCDYVSACTIPTNTDQAIFSSQAGPLFLQPGTNGGVALEIAGQSCSGVGFNLFADQVIWQGQQANSGRTGIGLKMSHASCTGPLSYQVTPTTALVPYMRLWDSVMRGNGGTPDFQPDVSIVVDDNWNLVVRGVNTYDACNRRVGPSAHINYSKLSGAGAVQEAGASPDLGTLFCDQPGSPQADETWTVAQQCSSCTKRGLKRKMVGGSVYDQLWGTEDTSGNIAFPGNLTNGTTIDLDIPAASTINAFSIMNPTVGGLRLSGNPLRFKAQAVTGTTNSRFGFGINIDPSGRATATGSPAFGQVWDPVNGLWWMQYIPTVAATATPTSTTAPTATNTAPTNTATPTRTGPTVTATNTPTPSKTSTPVNTITPTRTIVPGAPTWTSTPSPTVTNTFLLTPTRTNTRTNTPTATRTFTFTITPTANATNVLINKNHKLRALSLSVGDTSNANTFPGTPIVDCDYTSSDPKCWFAPTNTPTPTVTGSNTPTATSTPTVRSCFSECVSANAAANSTYYFGPGALNGTGDGSRWPCFGETFSNLACNLGADIANTATIVINFETTAESSCAAASDFGAVTSGRCTWSGATLTTGTVTGTSAATETQITDTTSAHAFTCASGSDYHLKAVTTGSWTNRLYYCCYTKCVAGL